MTALGNGIRPRNGLGTAALVLAIVGLASCWSVVGGIALGVAAVVLGFLGRGRAARGEADNSEIATGGIALGLLAVVVSLAFVAIWWFAWRDLGGTYYVDCVMRAGTDKRAADTCTDEWLNTVQGRFSVTTTTRGST